ncbi:hypothetical protein ACQLSH_001722 [Salmonella enterica]
MSAKTLKSDWDLTATERLLKEQKRLGLSDGQMAKILGLHIYFYYIIADEKPVFKLYKMSEEILFMNIACILKKVPSLRKALYPAPAILQV